MIIIIVIIIIICFILGLLCTTSLSPCESRSSQFDTVKSYLQDDSSRTVAKLKCGVCDNPKQASTDLLNYLNQSDITKRKANSSIPFFTPGSYISVTRADPFSPRGESKFVGICIAKRKVNTPGSTFILRNVVDGIGVEMMFELYSPAIKEIQVLKLEKRRRAKLYYLREKPPKYSTVKESMKPVPSGGRVLKYRRKPNEPA